MISPKVSKRLRLCEGLTILLGDRFTRLDDTASL